ncbi:pitrilysin family protein [Pelomonas sp. Root1444]|uniref:M16 family metallopeptidase n=1 Tax=Pelomonas sp. Root1444 TaxID=1736464 RepID=UPI0009E7EEAA|nr:M16 family metallopeptidase [Pelomonas sp. Root1444]
MSTKRRWMQAALVLLLALSTPAFAEPAALPSEQRTLGGITEYRLDNGLQVLLMPQAGAPRIGLTVTYRVGSRHEGPGQAGMAHLLEHVTFRGTASIADLGAEMQRLGVSFNGTTSTDRTNYLSTFPAGDAATTLQRMLRLEASRMSEARLAEGDFAKEKPIVLNEMGLHDGVRRMRQGLLAAAFRQHPYGRPVIGYEADIEQLSLPTLQAFYRRHYRPENAVLMLTGGFEPVQALAAVAEIFGPLKNPEPPAAALLPPLPEQAEPQQTAPRVMTLRTASTALAVGWRVPGMAHEHAAAVVVLAQLLGQVPARLTERKPERPFSLAVLGEAGRTRDPALLGLVVQSPNTPSANADSRQALLSLESQWTDRLQDLRRAISPELVRQMTDTRARELAQALRDPMRAPALISDAVGAGDWRLAFWLQERLAALKPAAVYAAADLYLRSLNRVNARGVTDAAVPRQAMQFEEQPVTGIASWFERPVEVAHVSDPAGEIGELKPPQALGAGDAFETDPVLLERASRRYLLPSGIKLGVLPRNSADERVAVMLGFRWGRADDMARLAGWRALSGSMLEAGAAGRTAATIRQLKKALQAELRVASGPQSVTVQLLTRRQHLAPALQWVKELLSEPDLPEAAFEVERNAALARLAGAERNSSEGRTSAPERERQHRMAQMGLQPGDAGYQPSGAELAAQWRALTVADVREFQRKHWSANDLRITVAGQVPEGLVALVENLFAGWKKPDAPAYVSPAPVHKPVAAGRFATLSPGAASGEGDGQPAVVISLMQELPLSRGDEAYYPMLVGTRILGGGAISGGRLAERLRVQDAVSYRVDAQLRVPGDGDRAGLRLQASGAPGRAAQVEAALREEVQRLLAEGVSAEEVAHARSRLLADRRQRLSSEMGLAGALMVQLEREISFAQLLAEEEEGLAAVTPERVLLALRRLLKPDQWVTLIARAPS